MRAPRLIVTAPLLLLAVSVTPLLRPTIASGASCITTVAGDTCLAQCIGAQQQACGSDAACHRDIAAVIRNLARTDADTSDCAEQVATISEVCGCVGSPSGAFLE